MINGTNRTQIMHISNIRRPVLAFTALHVASLWNKLQTKILTKASHATYVRWLPLSTTILQKILYVSSSISKMLCMSTIKSCYVCLIAFQCYHHIKLTPNILHTFLFETHCETWLVKICIWPKLHSLINTKDYGPQTNNNDYDKH
jgi:hypothetical protein